MRKNLRIFMTIPLVLAIILSILFVFFPMAELKYYQYKYLGAEKSKFITPFEKYFGHTMNKNVCFLKSGSSGIVIGNVIYCDFDFDQDLIDYHYVIGGYGFAILCKYDNNIISEVYLKRLAPDLTF